jgi:hypothetical protein
MLKKSQLRKGKSWSTEKVIRSEQGEKPGLDSQSVLCTTAVWPGGKPQ